MVKILEIIQSIFGIIAIVSFFACPISGLLFRSQNYALLFGTLFFLFFPLAVFMGKFTRNKKFSIGLYVALIAFLLFGLVCLYYAVDIFKTRTVYSIELQEINGIFTGSFNIPNDMKSDYKECTFYLEATYSVGDSGFGEAEKSFLLNFSGPDLDYNDTFRLSGERQKKKSVYSSTTTMKKFDYKFIPKDGDYNFEVYSIEGDEHLILKSVKIILKESR